MYTGTSLKEKAKKPRKAIDIVKDWLKENCSKGEPLEITYSPNTFVMTKTPTHLTTFSYSLKEKKPKKKHL